MNTKLGVDGSESRSWGQLGEIHNEAAGLAVLARSVVAVVVSADAFLQKWIPLIEASQAYLELKGFEVASNYL